MARTEWYKPRTPPAARTRGLLPAAPETTVRLPALIAPALVLALGLAATGCSSSDGASTASAPAAVASAAPTAAASAEPVEGSNPKVTLDKVKVGDCAIDPLRKKEAAPDAAVRAVRVVPCDQAHDSEVYAIPELPDAEFPGPDEVIAMGEQACKDAYTGYVGVDFQDSQNDADSLYPSMETYADGDRKVICFVVAPNGSTVTSSLKGSEG